MPDTPLKEALSALEDTQHKLVMLASRTDKERKLELLEERRTLALRMLALQQHAGVAPGLFAQGALAEEFSRRLVEVRRLIAEHQSCWSVVAIDSSPQEFRRSADYVSGSIQGLTGWMRAMIASER